MQPNEVVGTAHSHRPSTKRLIPPLVIPDHRSQKTIRKSCAGLLSMKGPMSISMFPRISDYLSRIWAVSA